MLPLFSARCRCFSTLFQHAAAVFSALPLFQHAAAVSARYIFSA
jgi:hypothetical protein